MPGVWYTMGEKMYTTPGDAYFTIGEIEGPADRDGVVASIPYLPHIPKAIVTTFHGLIVKDAGGVTNIPASKEKAAPLVKAGFTCMNEVYATKEDGTPTGITALGAEFVARSHLGFEKVLDVYGVFGGSELSDYPQRNGYSVWLAEFIL